VDDTLYTIDEVIARLLQGFYPYYDRDNEAFYWDREATRSIIELTPRAVRKATSMRSRISEDYRISWNAAPDVVLANLCDEQIKKETWVNAQVRAVYQLLREAGLLQTVEAYDSSGVLCGALLGIRLGKAFFAETMYSVRPNASKACLCELVLQLASDGFHFVDVQVQHEAHHPVYRLGETTLPLENYLERLCEATRSFPPPPWDLRQLSRFPESRCEWADAAPVLVDGRHGKTLFICGFQMIQDWEEPLMRRMGRAVSDEGGHVLEIGYGLGISAEAVQSASPAMHVIIEANRETAEAARRRFAEEVARGRVQVLEGFWQDVLPNWPGGLPLGRFTGVVFDPYPLSVQELRRPSFDFFSWAARVLAPSGRFTYFSDEPNNISPHHLVQIQACFPGATITTESVPVQPWPDCEYWESPTILHVVVTASAQG
jgi:guanidinoacetate N-methyltransferase